MKKFLFITPHTIPEQSGSGINVFHFASYINTTENIATIFSFNRKNKFKLKTKINHTWIIRPSYYNHNLLTKFLSLVFILPSYLNQAIKHDVVLIYGNKTIAYELLIILAKILRKKTVFQSLLYGVDDLKTIFGTSWSRKKAYRFLFQKIDLYYAINKKFADDYISLFGNNKKLFTFPQGIDPNKFHPFPGQKKELRKRLKLPESDTLILMAGFILERKRFVQVFENINVLNIPYKLIVLGEYKFHKEHFLFNSNKEAEVIKSTGENILGDHISFIGFVNNINEYMQACDIFIHNADNEVPNVVLEALASGMVVLTKSKPDLSQAFLEHNLNSILYSKEQEIPKHITEISSDSKFSDKLKRNAADFIKDHYTFKRLLEMLTQVIDD